MKKSNRPKTFRVTEYTPESGLIKVERNDFAHDDVDTSRRLATEFYKKRRDELITSNKTERILFGIDLMRGISKHTLMLSMLEEEGPILDEAHLFGCCLE
jgi:hypothetical protein